MRDPIVYIIQDTGKDFLPAKEFGEIRIVFPKHINNMTYNEGMTHAFEVMRDFRDHDYVVPTGDPLLIGLVVAVAFTKSTNQFQLLKWNPVNHKYEVHQIDG